ncbi:MAG: tetratricopeptide repeat protein, partial [Thermoanaerobaculia bacterium]|nr:tetratricopeptide repeat protein [Thermoanaerobaculia bacterium]
INNTFLGEVNYYRGRLDSAKILLHYALQLDTTPNEAHPLAYALLGAVATRENHPNEAEYYFQKAFSYYPDLFNGYGGADFKNNGLCLYGDFLLAQGRLTEAEAVYREVIGRDPGHYMPYYGMARLLAAQKQTDEVMDYLEMALERWYPIPGPILEEPLFKKLRKTKRFKALMARHFPKEE